MRFYNFTIYDKDSELPGGDYWKFLDATLEELQECGIYFFDFMRVWNNLKNEELKMKMRDKLASIIIDKGISYDGLSTCLEIFTSDEIKMSFVNTFNNKISVEEFLISNPEFTSSKNLLFPGQEVIIGITDPQVSVVVEKYSVEDKEISYQTEYQYDEERMISDEEVIQKGEDGLERVSQRIKIVNGVINYVDVKSREELKPTISEIVIKGKKNISGVGSTRNWLWPTNNVYTKWYKIYRAIKKN